MDCDLFAITDTLVCHSLQTRIEEGKRRSALEAIEAFFPKEVYVCLKC